ncbi:S-adenosyl-L-methionine-dependent methyltransferase [Sanghuangporus baumii]|uniref:rRNA adenine N(6)-methyltransferase n=1 Tax=Sanghuangporus baumii TaxID=108892 RepID=A0A9Q5NAY4_SANBA|nr:S-adenosyl-L-methionine-dependent methyltransferase [Sanghuangporus baumii]
MKLSKNKIKKLIVLEDGEPYLPYLKPLEEVDPRVKIIPMSGFGWPTYTALEAEGLLDDVIRKEWNGEIPNLHFVAHVPNSVLGEQLTNQFIRHIPERSWLFKYGRVPMSLLLSDYSYRRMTATNVKTEYCKLSVVAQAAASIKPAISREELQPYKDHFHPLGSGSEVVERKGSKRPAGAPYVAIQVNALQEQVIETGKLDKWDYVLRRMFVLKTTPIRRAISSLGPGAYNLLKRLGDPDLPPEERLDIDKKVRELQMRDWSIFVKRFDEWPFRPGDLDISEAIYKDVEREK